MYVASEWPLAKCDQIEALIDKIVDDPVARAKVVDSAPAAEPEQPCAALVSIELIGDYADDVGEIASE